MPADDVRSAGHAYLRPVDATTPKHALPQLGLRGILAVWAAAALPMGLLAWLGAPLLADQMHGASRLGRALIITLTAGLLWQCVLVVGLVGLEQRTLRWPVVRGALMLRAPREPGGGTRWRGLAPLILAFGLMQFVPGVPHPAGRDLGKFLPSHDGHALLAGSWGWFAALVLLFVLNTVLGEELLFRGYLLPRMSRAFGRRDWLANGVLFGVYHLHMPWAIPASVANGLIFAGGSKRYRSAVVGIAVHSAQSVFFGILALSVVLGG